MYHLALLGLACQITSVLAGFPPQPEGVTILQSRFHENVTISYKEPGICETTPGVKSYSGYVHLPPGFLKGAWEDKQDYPINTFFWFFEAREDPANAPLSIWLNGGPGGSSMIGAMAENGPCFVQRDSNSTVLNPYSWNNKVNMLYLDQPVQVGFSYDYAVNGTYNTQLEAPIKVGANFSDHIPETNNTFFVGTFASQKRKHTANSTAHAAHALWHFAQTWFEEFPFYKPADEKISLWTESYGGHYGPDFMWTFQQQNEKIKNGTISGPGTHFLHLDTLGIINGCIDEVYQSRAYADMAYNNTYGIEVVNETIYNHQLHQLYKHNGCYDRITRCRAAQVNDTNDIGDNKETNRLCESALEFCAEKVVGPYHEFADNGWFDIAHPAADPFPSPYWMGFLNQHWVQKALGVPVNFSMDSYAVYTDFSSTGDISRYGSLAKLGEVADNGVKVALVYGDRDYACNWLGGEKSSLALEFDGAAEFRSAGYVPFWANLLNIAGQVRQYGNVSFTRVYQAGHMVPSYQPEAAYELFSRVMFGFDISTGKIPVWSGYKTPGPADTWHIKNIPPPRPKPECYVLEPGTCTDEQFAKVVNGTAVVRDFILQDGTSHDDDDGKQGPLADL